MSLRWKPFFSVVAMISFVAVFAAGCGDDTGKANDILAGANASLTSAMDTSTQGITMITQAMDQGTSGQTAQETATLQQTQALENTARSQYSDAKAKLSEAAALNIDQVFKDYINAKVRAADASIAITDNNLAIIALLLADPTMTANPDSLTRLADLQTKEAQLSEQGQTAEDEAAKIARDNPDKIKTS
ncbi:MAG: hypothetical protein M1539_02410 [Actinobacteria bacterium]|nr:hypothetical protein [Actinomycetota bacterium]MCL5882819.1 hypothetical protein [Actinomycetota bacterium]